LATINYAPQGHTLKLFHQSGKWVRIIVGPLGSGKTRACLTELMFKIAGQTPDGQGVRRSRIVCCRNSYPDLLGTTIKDFKEMSEALNIGSFRNTVPPTWTCSMGLQDGTKIDAEVIFMAFDTPDDSKKARGLQLSGIFLNELKELSKDNFDILMARVGRYPARSQVPNAKSFVIADSNAPDRDHWMAKLALDHKPKGWKFFIQPAGVHQIAGEWVTNDKAENLSNLPDDYYQRLVGGKKESWVRQNLANEFVYHTDGRAVHPDFNQSLHVREVGITPQIPITVGIDFGRTPSAVIGQKQHDGRWHIVEEFPTENMGAFQFGELLLKHIQANDDYQSCPIEFVGDPAGNQMAQTRDETPFDMLRAAGINAIPAPTNDFETRTTALDSLLTRLVGGEPAILIHPRCTVLQKGLAGAYQFRRIKVAGDVYQDKPNKDMTSHTVEALHYLLIGQGEGPLMELRAKNRAEHDEMMENWRNEREREGFDRKFE
jgi:hypothetical protein